jgi:hypothetical protein
MVSITKPTVAGSTGTWGGILNTALDELVTAINLAQVAGDPVSIAETVRAAFLKTTSTTEHACTIYQASTTGTGVALNVVSDNEENSAMFLAGHEVDKGTLKISHIGQADGSDTDAAAVSVNLTEVGTAAQGVRIWSEDSGTIGNAVTVALNGRDDFVVKGAGHVGIGVATAHAPGGRLEIAQVADADVALLVVAKSGATGQLILLKDSAGNARFEVTAAGNSVHRALAYFTTTAQFGSSTAALGGGGSGCVGITNTTTVPTTDPSGGGVLYCEGGALKFRGSSGSVTTIAPA